MTHLKFSLKKLGNFFKIQKEKLKTEMNHDEINESNWREKRDVWLSYVKNDVFCTVSSYERYREAMVENIEFSMNDCLSLPGLGRKCFSSLRTEEDEPFW